MSHMRHALCTVIPCIYTFAGWPTDDLVPASSLRREHPIHTCMTCSLGYSCVVHPHNSQTDRLCGGGINQTPNQLVQFASYLVNTLCMIHAVRQALQTVHPHEFDSSIRNPQAWLTFHVMGAGRSSSPPSLGSSTAATDAVPSCCLLA